MDKSRFVLSTRGAFHKIIAMGWSPTSTAIANTEKLINLASCMTNEANKEANDLMARLVETEVDLPCLLLEAFSPMDPTVHTPARSLKRAFVSRIAILYRKGGRILRPISFCD